MGDAEAFAMLGAIQERTILAEKPDAVEWIAMVREVGNEEPDDLPSKERTYRVQLAYEGTRPN